MDKKSIGELRRRLKKDSCTFTKMCGCYVNDSKNKVIWNKYGSCGCHSPIRSMEKFTGKRTGSDGSHRAAGRGDAGEPVGCQGNAGEERSGEVLV